jgi:flagellar motor switch protein FliG
MAAKIEAPPVNQALVRQLVIGGDAQQRDLSGDEKAAVLLLSLGPDFGRPILEELDEMEIKILSRTMVRMGAVTQEMVDSLYAEFVTSISANGSVSGNSDSTQRLLMSFLPAERVDAIMEEIRGPAGRNMWEKLSNVQEDILATYLKNEYPQTIAVVLSKIDTEHASKVLAALPEDLAMDVVKRMLALDPVQKEILERSSRRCAPNSCRRAVIPSAATATSRWLRSSTRSIVRPRRASSPRSRKPIAKAPSASNR